MTLTRERLLRDLYVAFYDARRHKSVRSYVRHWENGLKANMDVLCDDLLTRAYRPMPSKCFIVDYPKKREIFAAVFRDRIVHHLYFNYTHKLFERTFIADSYSCIKGRGTHYGIRRVTDFCRRESRNWQRKTYAMHLDIRGYFMHIDRSRLLAIANGTLRKMAKHRAPSGRLWKDELDMDFLYWLTEQTVMLNPVENCVIVGSAEDWEGLDPQKSMLHLKPDLGLPIGNLTSQLFSNVYLNVFDQYMKRTLHCRYYGRYVDDAIVVSSDKQWLVSIVPQIREFLQTELGLELHMGKLGMSEVHHGVEFLGVFIRPWRTYISRKALERVKKRVRGLKGKRPSYVLRSVNSYLGIFRHTSSYRIRQALFSRSEFMRLGVFNAGMKKLTRNNSYKFN